MDHCRLWSQVFLDSLDVLASRQLQVIRVDQVFLWVLAVLEVLVDLADPVNPQAQWVRTVLVGPVVQEILLYLWALLDPPILVFRVVQLLLGTLWVLGNLEDPFRLEVLEDPDGHRHPKALRVLASQPPQETLDNLSLPFLPVIPATLVIQLHPLIQGVQEVLVHRLYQNDLFFQVCPVTPSSPFDLFDLHDLALPFLLCCLALQPGPKVLVIQ